jgi:hypothetical protein
MDLHLYILGIYRVPAGNFNKILTWLEKIIMRIYDTKSDFIICGDFSINYLHNDSNRHELDTLLMTYNLTLLLIFALELIKKLFYNW